MCLYTIRIFLYSDGLMRRINFRDVGSSLFHRKLRVVAVLVIGVFITTLVPLHTAKAGTILAIAYNTSGAVVASAIPASTVIATFTPATKLITGSTVTLTFPAGTTLTTLQMAVTDFQVVQASNGGATCVGGIYADVTAAVGDNTAKTLVLTLAAASLSNSCTNPADNGLGIVTIKTSALSGGNEIAQAQTATTSGTFTVATSEGLDTGSISNVVLVHGTATHLNILTAPSSIVSGVSMTQPVVQYLDAYNNIDTARADTLTVSVNNGTLTGSDAGGVVAVNGVVTYTNLVSHATADGQAITFTFTDDVGGVNLSGSPASTLGIIANVVATKLAFSVQPTEIGIPNGDVTSGVVWGIQPVIEARNADNIKDTDYVSVVTLSKSSGAGAITAGVGLSMSAAAGVASFTGKQIKYSALAADQETFVVQASDGVLTSGLSISLIADVIATKLAWTTQFVSCTSGAACSTQGVVKAEDAQNLVDTNYITAVTVGKVGAGTLVGTANQGAMIAGAKTTSGIGYTAAVPGETFTFTADSGVLTQGVSATMTSASVPTATPASGSYAGDQNVVFTAAGSTSIHYTTDGTSPTCATGITYSSPIKITIGLTGNFQVIACYGGGGQSTVGSYTISAVGPAGWGAGANDAVQGPISVVINAGAATTTLRNVSLVLTAGANAASMAVSRTADFANVAQEPVAKTKSWDLCAANANCPTGEYAVYVKFYTQLGTASAIYNAKITLALPGSEIIIPPVSNVPPAAPASFAGKLVKSSESSAVYYVTIDGKRHAFPNQAIYSTWYPDFSTVQTISVTDLATLSLGANVQYRPGVRMVKFESLAKTYAVGKGGNLRWITSEATAAALYGANWNTKIDDISDSLYMNYHFGADIVNAIDYSPSDEMTQTDTIEKNF